MVKNLICPVSTARANEKVVRLTALLVVLLVGLYIYTGSILFLLLLVVDFAIRAFTNLPYSPLSWTASRIAHLLQLSPVQIDKAPKIFAARVGLLFTLAMLVLFFVNPLISSLVGAVLIVFALLEAVLNLCVGCLVYTYLVFPLFKPTT